jgi:hypothetical protein
VFTIDLYASANGIFGELIEVVASITVPSIYNPINNKGIDTINGTILPISNLSISSVIVS